jgi:hypothetical protein
MHIFKSSDALMSKDFDFYARDVMRATAGIYFISKLI